MTEISREQGRLEAARAHGLDDDADDTELVAECLRRTASVRCPITPSGLVAAVTSVLAPLFDLEAEQVAGVLDRVVASGDLVEYLDEQPGYQRRQIYLGSPRYLVRQSGDVLLAGIRPDGERLVGEELWAKVSSSSYLRRIEAADADDIALLRAYGLQQINESRWMNAPEHCDAIDLVEAYRSWLGHEPSSGEIADLRILDPEQPSRYYRGRWRVVDSSDTGTFVARRSQGYGADLWCYVEIRNGEHLRLLDLPTNRRDRGCDEAWRLQAAIDAALGHPQELTIERTGAGRVKLGLPAPPPRWLQRRWDLIGEPTTARHTLFAYEFRATDTRDEVGFATSHLWMTQRIAAEEM